MLQKLIVNHNQHIYMAQQRVNFLFVLYVFTFCVGFAF